MKEVIKLLFKKMGVQVIGKAQANNTDAFCQIKKLLNNNTSNVVFDVGAAEGGFASEIKTMLPNSAVYAFEPQIDAYNYIVQNWASVCKPFQIAFTNAIGEHSFYITNNQFSSSLLKPNITNTSLDEAIKVENAITVKTDTIDNFCQANNIEHIHLLKFDIQGSELNALKGAENLLRNNKIDVIYSEVLFMALYDNQPLFHDIAKYLNGLGYRLYNIYNLKYINYTVICWADAIFIKNELYEAITT